MPIARQKSSAGLSIELSDKRKYYTVGSKVSGNVVLYTAQDFAIGSVSLEFYGRVKVHYVQSHGQGESHWRGRAPLFSESTLLFEGYHTHKPGSFSWPFAFDIPTNPDIAAIKQSKHQWNEKEHFLSTNDYIPGHPMPPTFEFRKYGWGYRMHVFVEYVLHVEVKQADGARMLLPPASREATLPILVKQVSTDTLNTHSLPLAAQFTLPDQLMTKSRSNNSQSGGSRLQSQVFRPVVRSSRLTTWNKSSTLPVHTRKASFSFREKTKQVFNSSSLPRFSFEVSVSTPETIQLLRENVIPFVISASPIREGDSTTIQPADYPDIRIDNASLLLTATTYLRCKGPFTSKPVSYDIKLLDRHPIDYAIKTSPHTGSDNSGPNHNIDDFDDHPEKQLAPNSVDLSKLPGVFIAIIAAKLGRQVEKPLSTTFNTYIIAREYKLKWKLELDVAGEKVNIQNDTDIPVAVLPPKPEDLDTIMNDYDATGAVTHNENEEGNDEMSDDSAEVEDVNGKRSLGDLIKLRKGKKTKEEEATEDRESPEQSASRPLQFHHDEMLPRYEQAPSDFGYRHEIDERPPGYENDNGNGNDVESPWSRRTMFRSMSLRSAKSPVIA